jgi:hypothetical protein
MKQKSIADLLRPLIPVALKTMHDIANDPIVSAHTRKSAAACLLKYKKAEDVEALKRIIMRASDLLTEEYRVNDANIEYLAQLTLRIEALEARAKA